jgi:hypothetical protein
MNEGEAEHVIATYREIAAHFRLKGSVQARVKAKRAGWPAEPQNHPADPLRLRVPQAVWDAGSRGGAKAIPREPRPPRNPTSLASHIPDFRDEIRGLIRPLEDAVAVLREERERLLRERDAERTERSAAQAEAAALRAERDAAQAEAATREDEVERLTLERDTERARVDEADRRIETERRRAAAAEEEVRALREHADLAEAARRGAEEELAGWAAGNPVARVWRALIYRRGRS